LDKVELQSAYHWFCDNCSCSNFALPIKAELTDEEAELIYRRVNSLEQWVDLPDGWRDFEMIQIPNVVKCSQCNTEYVAIDETIE